jgi:hypothetical protein
MANSYGNIISALEHTINDNNDYLKGNTGDTDNGLSELLESNNTRLSDLLANFTDEPKNKMRLVEINNYYANKYNDQSEIMKIIIVMCVIVLILWYINTIVQSSIFYVLIAIVVAIGCIIIFWKCYYLMLRNNIDYNQYDFDVKSSKLPEIDVLRGATGTLMSSGSTGAKSCQNQECCISPDYYSFKNGRCYSSAAAAALSEYTIRR